MIIDPVPGSGVANPEIPVNRGFDALGALAIYGARGSTTSGLTWGYYGGRYDGAVIANGTLTLTDTADNYIVMHRTTGAVSFATTTTNWLDTSTYGRLYKATTVGGAVTAVEDHRYGATGIFPNAGGAGGGVSPIGKHSIPVMAGSMRPAVTAGCAALAALAMGSGMPDIQTLDFSSTVVEYATFSIIMPVSWDEGTVTFQPFMSHAATTVDFGVVWELQAVAVSSGDTLAVAYGTAQAVTVTGGTTNNSYTGAESAAITIAGTPAAGDTVYFRISRAVAAGGDTMAIDARLHGIRLNITTAAATDA